MKGPLELCSGEGSGEEKDRGCAQRLYERGHNSHAYRGQGGGVYEGSGLECVFSV